MKNFLLALQFLTRIPVKINGEISEDDHSKAMVYFPLVGLIIGLFLVLVFRFCSWFFPSSAVSVLVLTAYALITGGLHIDGLADTCDGVYGGKGNKENILRIMKDSHIGAIGVLAICLNMLLRYVFLNCLPDSRVYPALISMAVIGRWSQVAFAFNSFPAADTSTAGVFSKNLNSEVFFLATGLTLLISLFLIKPVHLFFLFFVLVGVIVWFKHYLRGKINGITGDTIGALNEAIEIIVLAFFVLGIKIL